MLIKTEKFFFKYLQKKNQKKVNLKNDGEKNFKV